MAPRGRLRGVVIVTSTPAGFIAKLLKLPFNGHTFAAALFTYERALATACFIFCVTGLFTMNCCVGWCFSPVSTPAKENDEDIRHVMAAACELQGDEPFPYTMAARMLTRSEGDCDKAIERLKLLYTRRIERVRLRGVDAREEYTLAPLYHQITEEDIAHVRWARGVDRESAMRTLVHVKGDRDKAVELLGQVYERARARFTKK